MAKQLYTVQAGDYLRSIARDQLSDESRWSEIAYINELSQPYIIRRGQILLLPDDSGPLQVVVPVKIPDAAAAAPTKQAAFLFTPATTVVLLVVAAALLLRK